MREVVRQAIERRYPDARWSRPGAAPENAALVASLVSTLRKGPGEVFWQDASEYDFCDTVRVAHPDRKTLDALYKGHGTQAGRLTILMLSRIDLFFVLFWNVVTVRGGRPDVALAEVAPDEECGSVATTVRASLAPEGWQELSPSELLEPVEWLSPGADLEPPLSVKHCFFTQY